MIQQRVCYDSKNIIEDVKIRAMEIVSDFSLDESQNVYSVHKNFRNQAEHRFTVKEILLDRFYKSTLSFLESKNFFKREDFQSGFLSNYLADPGFEPSLNINFMMKEKIQHLYRFIPELHYLLNENLLEFLSDYLRKNILQYLFEDRELSKKNPFYNRQLRFLTPSSHLFLQRALLPYQQAKRSELRVCVLSWNLAGRNLLKEEKVLKRALDDLLIQNIDLMVFGFQEILELKMNLNFLKKVFIHKKISKDIRDQLHGILGNEYECISTLNLLGMLQVVFIRKDRVRDLRSDYHQHWEIKFGGNSKMKFGNKGAIGTMFELMDFGRFSFINCHLTSGHNKIDKRIANSDEITKTLKGRFRIIKKF